MKKIGSLICMLGVLSNAVAGVPQDENLYLEKLDNGMQIAIYPNSEPPKRVSMRLLVKVGSASEREGQEGIAHYMEHMAFNGTTHFPAGVMVEYFQRLGMAFGADTNAHTSFSETVYKLDLPEVSEKLIDDGLLLLRDYADGISFEEGAIDSERGVIIAEKKSSDTQDYRRAVKEIGHLFEGTVFASRMPIGKEEMINSFKRNDFLEFYNQYYRPENCVLVIVGDIDPKATILKAKDFFKSFKANEDYPYKKTQYGKLQTSDFKFSFDNKDMKFDCLYDCIENSTKSYSSITSSTGMQDYEDEQKKRTLYMQLKVLTNAITSRYLKLADSADSKITQGEGVGFFFDNECVSISFSSEAKTGKAFDTLEENFRQLLSVENLSDLELNEAKNKFYMDLDNAIASKATRQNRALANEIVSSFSDGETYTSVEYDKESALKCLADFDADQAKELLKTLFSNTKIKVFVCDNVKIDEKSLDTKVLNTYKLAYDKRYDVSLFASEKLKFSNFDGGETKIVAKNHLADLDITQISFGNNVKLNYKKTDFAKDEILVKVAFGNGVMDIPSDKPQYYIASQAFTFGGTKYQDISQINSAKFNLKMKMGFDIEGNTFALTGSSTKADLANLIKFMATSIKDTGFRDEGIKSLDKYAESFYNQYESEPSLKMRFINYNLMKGTLNKIPGKYEEFEDVSMAEIKAWLKPILENSYMEISVVGDFEEDELLDLIANTFGTLPKRQSKQVHSEVDVEFKDVGSQIEIGYKSDGEPRSLAIKVWDSFAKSQVDKMRQANLLGSVLDDVLRKDIREGESKVYSPTAFNTSSDWIKDCGFMVALTFVDPKYNEEVSDLLQICGDKLLKGISQDEFERAKLPLLKGVEANKRRNGYWLNMVLNMSQARPVNIDLARSIDTAYSQIKLEDLDKLAKEIFAEKAYTIKIMPKVSEKNKE